MQLLFDLFPLLLFFIAYRYADLYTATAVIMVASLLQIGWNWWRKHRVETMHLVTLGLVLVFGGLTLALHDKQFIMWKPTLVNWLFAGVFLVTQWWGNKTLIERMLGAQLLAPAWLWRRLNLAWAGFFMALGLLNLWVADRFWQAQAAWVNAAQLTQAPDNFPCDTYAGAAVQLCLQAQAMEQDWANFKVFGLLGLTLLFVLLQGIVLSRYAQAVEDETHAVPH